MKEDREATALETVPDALCGRGAKGQGLHDHLDEVVDAPAGHDGVVKHDGRRDEANEGAHPCELFPGNLGKRANNAHAAFAAEDVLRND